MSPLVYALLLILSAAIMAVLLAVVFRWRNTSGYRWLSLLLLSIGVWCLGGAAEVLVTGLPAKKLMSAVSYLGSQTCTVFFFLFVLSYTRQEDLFARRQWRLLAVVPLTTLLLVFTNDAHGLVWSEVALRDGSSWGPAHYARGPWFAVMVVYGYLLMVAALYVLWREHRRQRSLHARQLMVLAAAAMVPWAGHIIYMLRLPLFEGYDASPIGFALTGPLLVIAVYRYGLMDMVPVARDAVIETMREGLVVLDHQLRVIDLNPSACCLLHLTSAEACIGRSFPDLETPCPEVLDFCRRTDNATAVFPRTVPGRPPLYLEVNLTQLDERANRGRLLMLRDVSRRRYAEEALMASDARFRIAARKTGQLVYEYDVPSGTIIWAGAIEEITGYTEEEFRSFTIHVWEEHIHPEDRTMVMNRLAHAIQEHRDFTAAYRFRRRDGQYLHMEERAGFTTPAGQAHNRMVGIMNDVTPSHSLREQLHQSQKMEAIGRLAGGIAHDFNNLLMVILNSADFLRETVRGNPEAYGDVEEILHASRRASELTRQLLLFSRKQPLKQKQGCLGECVVNVEKMLHRIVGENIRIDVEVEPELPPVLMDAGLIELAIMNMAVNARDAMPEGGLLTLRASSGPLPDEDLDRMIEKPDQREARYGRVDIIDSGTGMSPAVLKRVFEPFFTTKGAGKGTGLGLSTSFGIIRQHAGYLAVDSHPDQGSRFTFYLPFQSHAVPLAAAEEQVFAHYRGRSLLVVEDDPSVRRILVSMLRELDLDLVEAEHGEDALTKMAARGKPIDLLLTDIVMPGMDGYRLAGRLREQQADLRVAYISGYPKDHLDLQDNPESEAPLLSKPFTRDELIRLLHQVFDPAGAGTVNA